MLLRGVGRGPWAGAASGGPGCEEPAGMGGVGTALAEGRLAEPFLPIPCQSCLCIVLLCCDFLLLSLFFPFLSPENFTVISIALDCTEKSFFFFFFLSFYFRAKENISPRREVLNSVRKSGVKPPNK